MILIMTGQGEKEESRGSENDESRGGETEESRGGENEESRGNVREKAGKKKKDDRRQSMQQKKGKRVSGEVVPDGKTVKVDDRRERGHSVRQESSIADEEERRLYNSMPTRGKNRGYSSEGRTRHGWWHGKCCSRARGNEQCREGGNVSHRW